MENKPSVLTKNYEVGRLLGQGTFAKVYFARSIRMNLSVAIKVIDKEKVLKVGLVNQIKREISVMRLVRHPNIVQLYEVLATKSKIYFVMEYAKGGELFDKVAKGRLKEDVAQKYFQQLINAVDFCHSRVINRKGYDGTKADIWSCGVVLFVLLSGYLPFHDSNLMEMYRKIGRAEFKCPNWFPTDARRLLRKILDPNPSTRISMAEIKESSWFRKALNSKQIKTGTKSEEVAALDWNGSGSSENSSVASEAKQESAKPPILNAFDIISLSAGFDLSGLFEENYQKREARFTSIQPASVIISKLEDIAKRQELKVIKKDAGLLKLEGMKEGRKGPLSVDAEIFEVTPNIHFVEVKKSNGDTLEYQKILEEAIRPALNDIVCVWQGEQELQQQQQQQSN
uniref:non-specific serine/threonine protein kinase n=1 Tax=Populus alba TaxID=43335 RepID=A0A4U5QEV5_POPAL|nr:CBL-interacting serine/threonine-protein kinase 10-like [Populus alba]